MDVVPPRIEVPLGLAPDPKTGKLPNYATNAKVANRIKSEIVPWVTDVRSRRAGLEEQWRQLLRVWTLEHEDKTYEGDHAIYMPAGKKVVDTLTPQLVSATFPGDDFFGVEAVNAEDARRALWVQTSLRHRLEQARVRVKADALYRQLVVTGNCPAKLHWKRQAVRTVRRGREGVGFETPETVLYDGPAFEVLDAASVYVWPETADSLADATLVFQDLTMPMSALRAKAREGMYIKAAVEAATGVSSSSQYEAEQARLESQDLTPPTDTTGAQSGQNLARITEVYCNFDPDAVSGESETNPVPFLITITEGGEVLRAIRNPFWHQRPPFVWARMSLYPGRFYGTGFLEGVRNLNILLNGHVNQGMDGIRYVLNPFTLVNPNLMAAPPGPMEPGQQFLVHDLANAMKFDRPADGIINAVATLATQASAWIADYGGAPPVLQGGAAPGRAFRTATGVGTAQRNAALPIQEIVHLVEGEVWSEVLFYFHFLEQQYAPDTYFQQMYNEAGQIERHSIADLAGDWRYRWLASSQADNRQVKGQQLLQLIQLLSSPTVSQALMSRGKAVDLEPLIARLYREVHGFRDFDKVVTAAGGPPGMPPGAVPPGMLPPAAAPGMESAGNPLAGENELLEGNEGFEETRMEANDLAALLGGLPPS